MECVSVTGKSVLLPSAFTGNTNIVLIAVRDSAWASLEMYRSHVNANIPTHPRLHTYHVS